MAKKKAMRYIEVSISNKDFLGNVTYVKAKAIAINARWCAYRAHGRAGWSLTHCATGYSAGKGLKTIAAVRSLAAALERAYPPKRWAFSKPSATKTMGKAKAIIAKHGAYL